MNHRHNASAAALDPDDCDRPLWLIDDSAESHGRDVFCTAHRGRTIPPEQTKEMT